MYKKKIAYTEEELYPKAREYFIQNCGIRSDSDKHKRMLAEGFAVRERGLSGLCIEALVSFTLPEELSEACMRVDGEDLFCRAFFRIRKENVKGAYLYMITAGRCLCGEDEPIKNQLFADVWGTAYVDAGRDLLEEQIAGEARERLLSEGEGIGYLSNSFGPGFYGMPTAENVKLARVLQSEKIGVSVKESGIMIPLKSCSGLYLIVRDPEELPKSACMACMGGAKGCQFCHIREKEDA